MQEQPQNQLENRRITNYQINKHNVYLSIEQDVKDLYKQYNYILLYPYKIGKILGITKMQHVVNTRKDTRS